MALTAEYHEQWFSPDSCRVLADLGRCAPDGTIIEIGSWEGCSTVALANATYPRQVHAVDTWRGSPSDDSSAIATVRDIFGQFLTNVTEWTQGNVIPHQMDWRNFLPTVTEPIALVFIDAEHTYAEVAATIAALRPKMTKGGIICGDDVYCSAVTDAVRDILGHYSTAASLWIVML